MTARPDSRATPAPTACSIAAVILTSAMSGTLCSTDAPVRETCSDHQLGRGVLGALHRDSPLQRDTGSHMPHPIARGSQVVHHRRLQTRNRI